MHQNYICQALEDVFALIAESLVWQASPLFPIRFILRKKFLFFVNNGIQKNLVLVWRVCLRPGGGGYSLFYSLCFSPVPVGFFCFPVVCGGP